jgi:hypothetical protein
MNESTRPSSLLVIADHTPGPHRTDSDDIWWWLPVIGPTASVLAFTLARHAAYADTCWGTDTLARTIGLAGNRSKLWLSLERLGQFRAATFVATDVLTIRLNLAALSPRQLHALPVDLADNYRNTVAS